MPRLATPTHSLNLDMSTNTALSVLTSALRPPNMTLIDSHTTTNSNNGTEKRPATALAQTTDLLSTDLLSQVTSKSKRPSTKPSLKTAPMSALDTKPAVDTASASWTTTRSTVSVIVAATHAEKLEKIQTFALREPIIIELLCILKSISDNKFTLT